MNLSLGFAHDHSLLKHYVSDAGPSIEVECRVNMEGVVCRSLQTERCCEITLEKNFHIELHNWYCFQNVISMIKPMGVG